MCFKFIYIKVKLKLNSGLSEKQHTRIGNTLEDDGTMNQVSLGWAKLTLFVKMERIVNCLQHPISFIFKLVKEVTTSLAPNSSEI